MHMIARRAGLALLASTFAVVAAFAEPSLAGNTVVTVSLWDKGGNSALATDLGLGVGPTDMSKATMGIKVSQTSVKAGEVTFKVTNASKDMIHEMIVIPIENSTTPLPYIEDQARVDEDAAHHLGEVSELNPGQSGALTLSLGPGKYALICNIPGHYMNGMWTLLTVTP